MYTGKCQYFNCGILIQPDHFLCYDHYLDWEENLIDQCPQCGRFKDRRYDLCLDCQYRRNVRRTFPQHPNPSKPQYQREHSDAWKQGDASSTVWYVYILKLSTGGYYPGQTRDLRARLLEHRDGQAASTKGLSPKLQWFEMVESREEATKREAQLKELVDRNPREIRKLIIAFNDLVRELESTQGSIR